ncbi:hypothetical protein EAO03_29165 [Klebsiella pneumoniae]|nr:hypothetical protein EAO03_29165 [Klebsiella pneumoniae]
MLTIGKKKTGDDQKEAPAQRDDKRWKIAGEALAINDVAFSQYHILARRGWLLTTAATYHSQ